MGLYLNQVQASLERATQAAAQLFGCPRLCIARAEERTHRRKAKSVWRGEKLLEMRWYLRDWQERKDPATIIVENDDRQREALAMRGQQTPEIMPNRQVTGDQNGRMGRLRRDAERAGNHPIDSIDTAVCENSKSA